MKLFIIILSVCLIGCAPTEVARLLGMGTERFRTAGKLYVKEIAKDYDSCYMETMFVLGNKMGGNFYRGRQQQNFVIFTNLGGGFPQATSSTELIVFFTVIAPDKTLVEVSSLNFSLSAHVAGKLFDWLEGRREGLFPEELKEGAEAKGEGG